MASADGMRPEAGREAATGQSEVAVDIQQVQQLLLLNALLWDPSLWNTLSALNMSRQ